jgi:protein TonB
MFDTLIESSGKKDRNVAGHMWSIVLHTVIIAGAVAATANAGKQILEDIREEKIQMVKQPEEKPPEPEKPPPPPDAVMTPPPPKGFQILTAPIEIPDVLPDIDLSKKMTDEADFTGRGVAGGTATGVVGGVPQSINTEATFFDFQVEKVAAQVPGTGRPLYPPALRDASIEGSVLASFVIDTTGRADAATFKVIKSSHAQFTAAIQRALRDMRFFPAEVGGRKVRQLVQQEFVFAIQ